MVRFRRSIFKGFDNGEDFFSIQIVVIFNMMVEYDKKLFKMMLIMYSENKLLILEFDFLVFFDELLNELLNGFVIIVCFLRSFFVVINEVYICY